MLGWLGIGGTLLGATLDYIVGAGLLIAGIWLAAFFTINEKNPFYWLLSPLRIVGYATAALGIAVACVAFGKTLTAKDCIAASQLASVKLQLAFANRDLENATDTAKLRGEQLATQAETRKLDNEKIAEWQTKASKLKADLRRCRAATRDDDRGLCGIVGNESPGCSSVR